ncbi:MAG: hypothetical protein AYK19_15355 [Theionarchaea archaeon DG-70-1]|nr:MAG: hypothetical protein AYK19_15355 [Theionarchaea archaeon DG-70-1]
MEVELLYTLGKFILYVIVELSIILIIAMIVAELILDYVDLGKVAEILGRRGRTTGMLLSVLFGLVTPFCACSTIPVVVGMNNAKLPFGITMSFLLASPVLSFMILGGITAVFNLEVAILYLLLIALSALLIGNIMEAAGMSKYIKRVRVEGGMQQADYTGMTRRQEFMVRLKGATIRGLTACKRIIPYIILGACLGTITAAFFTEEVIFRYLGPQNFYAVPAASAVGIPLAIDPAATLSLCLAFHAKGASMGTVMAFLISTIGASIPMFVMLSSIYKKKLIVVYVGLIYIAIVAIGFIFNALGS